MHDLLTKTLAGALLVGTLVVPPIFRCSSFPEAVTTLTTQKSTIIACVSVKLVVELRGERPAAAAASVHICKRGIKG